VLNDEVAGLFEELAELTKLEDLNPQSFRARAYESAARATRSLPSPASEMSKAALVAVKGIGGSSADKILEFVEQGRIDKLERLREQFSDDYRELVRIPGIGGKTAAKLRSELGIESVEALKEAIAAEKLRDLPGLGAKTEEKIARSIERLGLTGKDRRVPISEALPAAERLVAELRSTEGVQDAMVCGSLRRMRETIGDVDILVSSHDPDSLARRVRELPAVREIIGAGDTKISFLTQNGLQVDVRVVEPGQFGAATLYFTGSKAHNIRLRQIAQQRDLLLNEYALADAEDGSVVAAATEEDVYGALDLAWIPPPMREDDGEIERARIGPIDVVSLSDINGDLHVHTDLSGDGEASLEEMVAAAAGRGYGYVAITDHAEDLAINGASREQMLRQRLEIGELQESYPDLRILHGSELNIAPDGGVDYDPEFLSGFDYTVASIHSHFDLPQDEQTVRIITAMGNPNVTAIGHLSGRMIGRRPGVEFDVDAVLEAAALTGTAIEINGSLNRLDAPSGLIRKAHGRDIYFVIDTDAHRVSEYDQMRWGVLYAQRGWLGPSQCVNTWSVERFLEFIEA